jgi:DNA-binding transcriptional ArsR family regulator
MAENAPGIETWKEHTSAFDRVRSIAETVSQPRSASHIADESLVAENTARNHLERLVDMHILLKTDREGRALYTPDPLYLRVQTLRELLDEYDHEGLIELKEELLEQIETWREEYDVTAPEELRERAAEAEALEQTSDIRTTANDWELAVYRLAIVEDAIANYATYRRDDRAPA